RVRRWPWLPACEAVGCVSARVMGAGNDARADVVLEAALPGPVRILLGCSEGQGPDRFLVDPGDEQTSSYHHVIVELPGEIPPVVFLPDSEHRRDAVRLRRSALPRADRPGRRAVRPPGSARERGAAVLGPMKPSLCGH